MARRDRRLNKYSSGRADGRYSARMLPVPQSVYDSLLARGAARRIYSGSQFRGPLFRVYPALPRRQAEAKKSLPKLSFRLQLPKRDLVCVRRKVRRGVMFARSVAGRSGSAWPKPRRRSIDSSYSC